MKKPTVFQQQSLNYFIYNHKDSTQHFWGDRWIHWKDLYEAEKEIDKWNRKARLLADIKEKFGTIRYYFLSAYDGSLKSILQPSVRYYFEWYPDCFFLYKDWKTDNTNIPKWFVSGVNRIKMGLYHFIWKKVRPAVDSVLKIVSRIDYLIARPHLPFYHESIIREEDAKHPTLFRIDRWIRENVRIIPKWWIRWVQNRQFHILNKGYQQVALKYPYLVHELVMFCDLHHIIKPFGPYKLDGDTVWSMHWKPVYEKVMNEESPTE